MQIKTWAAVGALCSLVAGAQAGVTYELSVVNTPPLAFGQPGLQAQVKLSVADFLTTPANFTATDLSTCNLVAGTLSLSCTALNFYFSEYGAFDSIGLAFKGSVGDEFLFHFDLGTFSQVGSFSNLDFDQDTTALLRVSQEGVTPPTPGSLPEPASLALVGAALALMGRRRAAARTPD